MWKDGQPEPNRGDATPVPLENIEPLKNEIGNAIQKLNSPEFQDRLTTTKSPYGFGGASEAIVEILERTSLDGILKKKFYDKI